MAAPGTRLFRSGRRPSVHRRDGPSHLAVATRKRWQACSPSGLSRAWQLSLSRPLRTGLLPGALLQEWRTTPRLEMKDISSPPVVLDPDQSGAAAGNALADPSRGPGRDYLCMRLAKGRGAQSTTYCERGKPPVASCPTRSPSTTNVSHLTEPGTAKPPSVGGSDSGTPYCEAEIGTGAFITDLGTRQGFRGIMRCRSEDFVVREIGLDGRICEFSDSRETPPSGIRTDVTECVSLHQGNVVRSQPPQCAARGSFDDAVPPRSRRQTRRTSVDDSNDSKRPSQTRMEECRHLLLAGHGTALPPKKYDCGSCAGPPTGRPQRQPEAGEAEGFSFKFVLGKRNRETPEALEMISRETGIPFAWFSFAGMKDRRAVTLQWVSCRIPRRQSLSDAGLRLPLATSCRDSAGHDGGHRPVPCTALASRESQDVRPPPPATDTSAVEHFASLASCPAPSPAKIAHAHRSRPRDLPDMHSNKADVPSAHSVVQPPYNGKASSADSLSAGAEQQSSGAANGLRAAVDSEPKGTRLEGISHIRATTVRPESSRSTRPASAEATDGAERSLRYARQNAPKSGTLPTSARRCVTGFTKAGRNKIYDACAEEGYDEACSRASDRTVGSGSSFSEQGNATRGGVDRARLIHPEGAFLAHMEDFSKRAMGSPSWDPCVSWGSFRPGKVYLGGLTGNRFTILLRNFEFAPVVLQVASPQKTEPPMLDQPRVIEARAASEQLKKRGGLVAGNYSVKRQTAEGSTHGVHTHTFVQALRAGANARGLADKRNASVEDPLAGGLAGDYGALIGELNAAARILHEKGFVNYFGPQRFGAGARPTLHVGRALLRRQDNLVCDLIMQLPVEELSEPTTADGANERLQWKVFSQAHFTRNGTMQAARTQGAAQAEDARFKQAASDQGPGPLCRTALTPGAMADGFFPGANTKARSRGSMPLTQDGVHGKEPLTPGAQKGKPSVQTRETSHISVKQVWTSVPTPDQQRAFAAAQDAYWKGDFWRAYALLPRTSRLERLLLRQLAASRFVQNAARAASGGNDGGDWEEGGEGDSHPGDGDTAECVDAAQLAAAAGAITEGSGRREAASTVKEVVRSSLGVGFAGGAQAAAAGSTDVKADASEVVLAARGSSEVGQTAARGRGGGPGDDDFISSGRREGRGEDKTRRVGGAALAPRAAVRRAIAAVPRLQRLMYVKAYAAYLWNKCATERVRLYGADHAVPGDLVLIPEHHSGAAAELEAHKETKPLSTSGAALGSHMCLDVPSEGTCARSRVRILTQEDCAQFEARHVVLPLIGVGAVLPRNAVGDYMAKLLEKEGLTESMYQRKSEYFLDVVYRPLLSYPKDFACELLRLHPGYPGVVPDSFLKGLLSVPETLGPPCVPAASQCANGKAQSPAHREPKIVWSFGVGGAATGSSKDREPQRSHTAGGAALQSGGPSCSTAAEAMTGTGPEGADSKRDADTICRRGAVLASSDSRQSVSEQGKKNFCSTSANGLVGSGLTDSEACVTANGEDTKTEDEGERFGLRLSFTLDAGVFASSALREFLHSPFLHPFAQRSCEMRCHPERANVEL